MHAGHLAPPPSPHAGLPVSAGLLGLLDDVAAIAKAAAATIDDVTAAAGKATAKAAGVVIDDTAVAPQFVTGVTPDRELPIVKRIALGSIRNKLLIILPVALLLSWAAPWALAPILMAGGLYLAYEGAEKTWERVRGQEGAHGPPAAGSAAGSAAVPAAVPAAVKGASAEKTLVSGAVRTDLILSAEIMVISLNEVAHETFWDRLIILVVVAVAMTVAVYGVVGLIVKTDDIGLALTRRQGRGVQAFGRALVAGMPKALGVIAVVGTVAMLWVGGHILLNGVHELGWTWPFDAVRHVEHTITNGVAGVGGILGWLFETLCATIVGLAVGAVVLAVMHLLPRRRAHATHGEEETPA